VTFFAVVIPYLIVYLSLPNSIAAILSRTETFLFLGQHNSILHQGKQQAWGNMTSIITKLVTKKILGETVANKFGTEDPYFEHVPATRLDGKPNGKIKKRKKALPPGITDNDAKVLTKVKRRAYRLDLCLFSCFGIRFGWGSVIGLVPA
jgi:hypothetical protein